MAKPPCDDTFVVLLDSESKPESRAANMERDLMSLPGIEQNYMDKSTTCASLYKFSKAGNPIYEAFIGPYPTLEAACAARDWIAAFYNGPYVAGLSDVERASERVEAELDAAHRSGASLLTVLDESYPTNLHLIPNLPPFLFVLGGPITLTS